MSRLGAPVRTTSLEDIGKQLTLMTQAITANSEKVAKIENLLQASTEQQRQLLQVTRSLMQKVTSAEADIDLIMRHVDYSGYVSEKCQFRLMGNGWKKLDEAGTTQLQRARDGRFTPESVRTLVTNFLATNNVNIIIENVRVSFIRDGQANRIKGTTSVGEEPQLMRFTVRNLEDARLLWKASKALKELGLTLKQDLTPLRMANKRLVLDNPEFKAAVETELCKGNEKRIWWDLDTAYVGNKRFTAAGCRAERRKGMETIELADGDAQ